MAQIDYSIHIVSVLFGNYLQENEKLILPADPFPKDVEWLTEEWIKIANERRQKTRRIKENTVQPIKWKVLERMRGKALLISKDILDIHCFDGQTNVWKNSELRRWLNGTFMNTAFTDDEKAAILKTELPDVGTTDKVFLLSLKESYQYHNELMLELPSNKAGGLWWLRTPPYKNLQRPWEKDSTAFCAHCNELPRPLLQLDKFIRNVSCDDIGVRPAVWVNLGSDVFECVEHNGFKS